MEQSAAPFDLPGLENVRALHPIRVLLVGRDARYLRSTAFLLAQRGYETRRLQQASRLVAEAEAFRADVVLLDEGRSFADAALAAANLLASRERVAVIVATARENPVEVPRLRFVEKWASFEVLVEALERSWAELPAQLG